MKINSLPEHMAIDNQIFMLIKLKLVVMKQIIN